MPFISDVRAVLQFYSRLPFTGPSTPPDFARMAGALPVAGAILGAIGGAALLISRIAGFAPLVSASVAIAALALSTGALHEDGLADTADGLGGGATKVMKLAIMRDSRLGAFGVLALCLATLLRVGALSALIEESAAVGAGVLLFVGAASRVAGLAQMALLRPAQADGIAASARAPTPRALWRAFALASVFALAPLVAGVRALPLALSLIAVCVSMVLFARLVDRQIGGYTGDTLGAAQQIAEIVALAVLSAR
ncbi:MAG: adenosylcobinamide-GDP ribazoletransferase [Methylocystis sp.]|nr:adenosylcobinamide-GDP ribazoletransferase [Methylocystis sp.]